LLTETTIILKCNLFSCSHTLSKILRVEDTLISFIEDDISSLVPQLTDRPGFECRTPCCHNVKSQGRGGNKQKMSVPKWSSMVSNEDWIWGSSRNLCSTTSNTGMNLASCQQLYILWLRKRRTKASVPVINTGTGNFLLLNVCHCTKEKRLVGTDI
jgi:hypothetical protein